MVWGAGRQRTETRYDGLYHRGNAAATTPCNLFGAAATAFFGEIIPGRRRPWLKRGPGQVKRHGCWWFIGCDAGIPSWLDHHYRWRADDGREFWFSEPYGITDLARAQLAEVEAAGWRVLIDDQSMHGFRTLRIAFWREGAGQ